jgi:hypothetical protein
VICACAPVDGRETVVGLGELLGEVLQRRAEGHAARVA